MEDATEPRVFPIPLQSITMSERRLMASKFGVNWDAIEVELADMPRPEDPDNPTDAEKLAAAKVFTRIVGPNEKFALLFIAVKRKQPTTSEAEIVKRVDAGEWSISLSDESDDGEVPAGPLPAPSATTSSANS